jgi:predicted proteasome-type protease
MTTVKIELPEDLARKAEAAGLLTPEAIEQVLREALRRDAGKRLLEISKRMQAANIPPMTMEEIQAEVDAVRAERRAKRNAPGS